MFVGEPKLPAVDRCARDTCILIQGKALTLHAVIAAADARVLERGYEEVLVPARGISPLRRTLLAAITTLGRRPMNRLHAKRVCPCLIPRRVMHLENDEDEIAAFVKDEEDGYCVCV